MITPNITNPMSLAKYHQRKENKNKNKKIVNKAISSNQKPRLFLNLQLLTKVFCSMKEQKKKKKQIITPNLAYIGQ